MLIQLPFSEREFLDVFAAYNSRLWPVAAALWLASAGVFFQVLRGSPNNRLISVLLSFLWLWSAAAYHAGFFAAINPAAWLFAALFLAQAFLLGVETWRDRIVYRWRLAPVAMAGAALGAYALLYPLVAVAVVEAYPRAPTYGVPCPTTLFTVGLLLLAEPVRLRLLVIPLFWTIVGGSASVLFGVFPDFMLLLAAAIVLIHAAITFTRRRQHAA